MTDIDRAITEEIFEECWHEHVKNNNGKQRVCASCGEEWNLQHKSLNTPYSTSWEAMGRLIEKMREDWWYVEIRTVTVNLVEKYNVLFWNESEGYEYEDKELPMAVAMAALEAKRGER